MIIDISSLSVQERRRLKWYDRKRIRTGYCVPLDRFIGGERVFRHYPMIAGPKDQFCDFTMQMFHGTFAGES